MLGFDVIISLFATNNRESSSKTKFVPEQLMDEHKFQSKIIVLN